MANELLERITKYATSGLDSVLAVESASRLLEEGKKWVRFEFTGAKKVKIGTLVTSGLANYSRANEGTTAAGYVEYTGGENGDGYKRGDTKLKWTEYELQWDRAIQLLIDEISDEQDAGLVIGNALTELNRTQVVPEIDTLRFSYIASCANATLGNLVVGDTPTALNDSTGIIHKFNVGFEWLKEHSVPEEDEIIYVNPTIMTLIRNTAELQKWITQAEYKVGKVTFTIQEYMGRPIETVVSDRFVTNVIAGANGTYAGTNSKAINFMIVSKKAVIPFVKIQNVKTFDPKVVQDSDAWKVDYHIFHGCIIPVEKIPAIYVSLSTNSGNTVTNLLSVALDSGAANTQWVFKHGYTNPSGKLGTIVYSSSEFTLNSTYTIDGTNIKSVADGDIITESAAITDQTTGYYFAMLDGLGVCIAKSPAIVKLPVKN